MGADYRSRCSGLISEWRPINACFAPSLARADNVSSDHNDPVGGLGGNSAAGTFARLGVSCSLGIVAESKRSKIGWFFWGLGWAFKFGFALSAVVIPLLGIWIASSLAALHDGPVWLSLLVGALCFPLLPVAWDLWARYRRRKAGKTKPPILTRFDRLLLRTLAINLVFVGGLLATFPQTVFTALSNRGDWMLDHVDGDWKESPRQALFATAESMAWFHEWTHPNEFEDMVDRSYVRDETGDDDPQAGQSLRDLTETLAKLPEVTPQTLQSSERWPFRDEIHPLAKAVPAEVETTPQSVAKYIAARENDPLQRVKALHDYVANRVAYDIVSLRAGQYPPQDAETVFRTQMGVCAGYANLLAAMGDAAGVEIVVVVGDTRDFGDPSPWGNGHAWNAFKIEDHWYLMDATWNAGHVGDTFVREYEASYFMTPPEVFGLSHFPDDPKWQLLAQPITRGEFMRRPDLRPNFYALGFEMDAPAQAQIEARASQTVSIEVDSEYGFEPSASVYRGSNHVDWCTAKDSEDGTTLQCTMPSTPGDYRIGLFGPEPASDFMGRVYISVK